MRPRCDPFDVSAVRIAIERGETTERAAYLAYAATAGRPYARSTFSIMLRRKLTLAPDANKLTPDARKLSERSPGVRAGVVAWRDAPAVKPRIVSLSPGGGLRVRAGALVIFDGAMTRTYGKAGKPPLAIVLSTAGGFVSMEAIRFCARANVAIVLLSGAWFSFAYIGRAGQGQRGELRAQVRADPVPIARTIVAAKIGAMRRAGALADQSILGRAAALAASLDQIRTSKRKPRVSHGQNRPRCNGSAGLSQPTGPSLGSCGRGSTPRASAALVIRSMRC